MVNRCYLCKEEEETINHLLLNCQSTWGIWVAVYRIVGVERVMGATVDLELKALLKICVPKCTKNLMWMMLSLLFGLLGRRERRAFERVESLARSVMDRWPRGLYFWHTRIYSKENHAIMNMIDFMTSQ